MLVFVKTIDLFVRRSFKISTENSPRSHCCCGRIPIVLFMTLLEGEDLHIKIHQWWHQIPWKNSQKQHVRRKQTRQSTHCVATYVVQQHNLIIIRHSIPEPAMNQHIENPGRFKPWPFDPRWSAGGHQQTTNLSKGVTFQPSRKRARSQNCQVRVFSSPIFLKQIIHFLLYVRIRYSFSDLKVFDKSLFYGVLLQKKLLFWGLRGIEINAAM